MGEVLGSFAIIYASIGVAVAALMALGMATSETRVSILGREVEAVYAHAAMLVCAACVWPLVVWLIVSGRRREAG